MHTSRRPGTVLTALVGFLSLLAGQAAALTAATGTVNVTVVANPIVPANSTISISATFDDATYDLVGVNLGASLGTVSASNVALTNLNLATGAHFVIPFRQTGDPALMFEAAGDIACPADGCASPTPAEIYAFVGFLQNVNAGVGLPAGNVYTFDGSASCTISSVTLTCSGPFALNAFPADEVVGGPTATIDRTVTFHDPTPPGSTRSFTARIVLSGITNDGVVSITGLSRYRGAIPAGYALASGGFNALFFDIASDVAAAARRVCVEVDADLDGIVDGTTLTLPELAILHATTPGNPFAAVPLVFLQAFVCADVVSFSPFVLLVDLTPPTTTTTIPGGDTTTTTTLAPGASTTTTVLSPPTTSTTLQLCTTARECLQQTKARPLCEEPINPKLQRTIAKRTAAADARLGKAASTTVSAKAARFRKQAKAAINAILKKADAFVNKKKGAISPACRDAIRRALQPVISRIDASEV